MLQNATKHCIKSATVRGPIGSPCRMRQAALERSLLDLAREVNISANRKSAQLTACVGTSTRPSVRQKKNLGGLLRTLAGATMSTAAALYMSGGTRIAAAVALEPPVAQRAVLEARHAAAKHTSTRARAKSSLEDARKRLSASA